MEFPNTTLAQLYLAIEGLPDTTQSAAIRAEITAREHKLREVAAAESDGEVNL